MPYNFVADIFHTKKLCSRVSSSEVRFPTENGRFAFLSFFGERRGNVRWSPLARWKARCRLPVSVNWTFLLDATVEALRANIDWQLAISLQRRQFDPKFQIEAVTPTNHTSCHKTKVNGLSFGIRMRAQLFFVLSQITKSRVWQTDRQTDRNLIAIPRLHSTQRGKNETTVISATPSSAKIPAMPMVRGIYPDAVCWALLRILRGYEPYEDYISTSVGGHVNRRSAGRPFPVC